MRLLPTDIAELTRIADSLAEQCGDDERLFHDMITGETDVDHILTRAFEQIARDGEMLAGIAERQTALAERKARVTARQAAGKAFIGKVLRSVKLAKLELPEVTLSVRDGKPSLRVVDPDAVPADLCRVKTEPNKTAINEAYADATDLPNWLVRSDATDVVTVRVK
jgi:hypothetical protein